MPFIDDQNKTTHHIHPNVLQRAGMLIKNAFAPSATKGKTPSIHDLSIKTYSKEEISQFIMSEAIEEHPLVKKLPMMRSKYAYKEIFTTLHPTTKYLLPGQVACFHYEEPKFKAELEFYDKLPLVLFLGITRTKEGNIREVGLNLHYFPPFTRKRILEHTYATFKSYFDDYFNAPSKKPNLFISWKALKSIMKRDAKLAFGIKMYIPVLRGATYLLPTKMLPTAFYTEGVFSKATKNKVFRFWRRFVR